MAGPGARNPHRPKEVILVMKFTMSRGAGSPPGSYAAKFVRAESFEENAEKFGPAVKLVWTVKDGPEEGVENAAVCSARLSTKSNLGKFAVALNGGPIEIDEEVDFERFVGVAGLIVVEESPSGNGTRVTAFVKS
jgi:hypothetical protein